MGNTMAFLQSPGVALRFIVISSSFAKIEITASPPNFKISPGMPSGPKDFFFPIADKRCLIMLIVMVKGFSDSVYLICGLLCLQLNRDA
jgi:hypothetical protein